MGNYLSCALNATGGRHSKGAKVVTPDGDLRQFDCPINAAELMFETPNHFVVNSKSLKIGRRFCPLSADENLEIGNVYVMFPMRRVNSLATAADIGALLVTANSAARRSSTGKARVLPESGAGTPMVGTPQGYSRSHTTQSDSSSRLSLDDMDDDSLSEIKSRLSSCRSRRPMLETIVEENVFTR